MSDTSGPTSVTRLSPFAQWSPSLRTWTDTGLLGLTLSLGTLPAWGCLRDGELFELPTPERPTDASESSSLLPSPISRDVKEQTLGWTWERDSKVQVDTLPRAITSLLPTPKAGDGERGRDLPRLRPDEASRELATAVGPLLPTPTATDTPKHAGQPPHKRVGHQARITDVIEYLPQWGQDDPLLPTPTVMDMGANYTPEEWAAWKAKQQAAHQNGNGHGASLTQEAISLLPTPRAAMHKNQHGQDRGAGTPDDCNIETVVTRIGASTPPRFTAGSPSSDDPLLLPLFPAPTDDHA